MHFELLSLADGANRSQEGTMNVLGMGRRVVEVSGLPEGVRLFVVGQTSASVDEIGTYALELAIVEPDGTREVPVTDEVELTAEGLDPLLPIGFAFVLEMSRPFRLEGIHRIEATFGDAETTYAFNVRRSAPQGIATETPKVQNDDRQTRRKRKARQGA